MDTERNLLGVMARHVQSDNDDLKVAAALAEMVSSARRIREALGRTERVPVLTTAFGTLSTEQLEDLARVAYDKYVGGPVWGVIRHAIMFHGGVGPEVISQCSVSSLIRCWVDLLSPVVNDAANGGLHAILEKCNDRFHAEGILPGDWTTQEKLDAADVITRRVLAEHGVHVCG